MTREEAIKMLRHCEAENHCDDGIHGNCKRCNQRIALDMAIEALEGVCFDEWCTDCKEYDTEKNCCPRFNRVIRGAMKRIPHDDGTLEVKVEDATKIGRVLISDDEHRGGLYYPDEDELQGDLISRAEAIEAIELVDWYHQNKNKDMVHGANDDEHQAWYKADDVYKALEAIPSVDKQRNGDLISRAEAIETLRYAQHRFTVADEAGGMGSVKWSEDVIYFAAAERVLTELPSADRPRGEWTPVNENPKDEKRIYLVQLDSGGMCSCRWTNVNPIWTDLTTEWHWCIFDIPQYCKVVAWMDLEPYKGGEDE